MTDETPEPLSEREIEILRLVATGAANKEIAARLVISPNTVKVHLRNIFTKIGVVSRTEATLYALKNGLMDPSFLPKVEETPPVLIESPITPLGLEPLGQGEAPTPRRSIPLAGILLLAVTGILALTALGWTLLNPPPKPSPTPTQAQPVIQTVQSRWASAPELPEAGHDMAMVVYENRIYLFGGQRAGGTSASTLRYDLREMTWSALAEKPTAVSQVQGVVLGEKVYLPGGQTGKDLPIDVFEAYDLRQDSWQTLAPLPTALSRYGLAAYEGKLYLFGGWDGTAYTSKVYQYDPEFDAWTERTPLPGPRGGCGTVTLEGKLLVIGGFDGTQALSQTLAYYPNRDSGGESPWEERPALPSGRYELGAAVLANSVYVFGGKTDNPDPLTLTNDANAWTAIELPPQPIGEGAVVLAAGNYLHVFGGALGDQLSSAHQVYQALYTIAIPYLDSSQ